MSTARLAVMNFKSNFRNYLSLILSLAFTTLVFYNFQNIIYSDTLAMMGERNKEYTDLILQIMSFILGCFTFFFIWYATNVFLTNRKKEMGIYIFMGLTNKKIGFLFLIEMILTGICALVLGISCGMLTAQLFQMILGKISDISVELAFSFPAKPIGMTGLIFAAMYLLFAIKSYREIVKSSVKDLLSAGRQNEYLRQKEGVLLLKAAGGIIILFLGYYLAVREGGMEVLRNILAAVIFVTTGIYLLFAGGIPLLFQKLINRKTFLYAGKRILWVNQMAFRMKKSYRTYAIVCVMMLCAVTALSSGFAMKYRYENIVHFRNTYTFQLLSTENNLDESVKKIMKDHGGLEKSGVLPILGMDKSQVEAGENYVRYGFIAYSSLKKLAEETRIEFSLKNPADGEVLKIAQLPLLSLITKKDGKSIKILGQKYDQISETSVPYLGYLQENVSFYVVNDKEYQKLIPKGAILYTYHYKISDLSEFAALKKEMREVYGRTAEKSGAGKSALIAVDPNSTDLDWIKILYSLCIFMFLVFILAGGSVLFMKIYNDAFEERGRYLVLKKTGIDSGTLRGSVVLELLAAFLLPFLLMTVSSRFSLRALEKMMNVSLLFVNLISVLIIFAILMVFYFLAVKMYLVNAKISQDGEKNLWKFPEYC